MPQTPSLQLPYPDPADAPDVPYWLQQLAEAVDEYLDRPMVKIRASATAQSLTNATVTTIDFAGGTVVHDLGGPAMADIAGDRIVIQEAGWYVFTCRVAFNTNASGYRGVLITRTVGAGDQYVADDYRAAASGQATIVTLRSEEIYCEVGEAFVVQAIQTSGAALTVMTTNGRPATFSARQIRPA